MQKKKKPKKPVLRNCAVPSCGTKKAQDKGFYEIPKIPKLRKAWFEACGITLSDKQTRTCWKHFKIKCPGCFTVSRYTFWNPIFFDEKSIIQAILRYMGHRKWTKSQI